MIETFFFKQNYYDEEEGSLNDYFDPEENSRPHWPSSFTLTDDFETGSSASFAFPIQEADGLEVGDAIFIPASEMKNTELRKTGWAGVVNSISFTRTTATVVCLGFDRIALSRPIFTNGLYSDGERTASDDGYIHNDQPDTLLLRIMNAALVGRGNYLSGDNEGIISEGPYQRSQADSGTECLYDQDSIITVATFLQDFKKLGNKVTGVVSPKFDSDKKRLEMALTIVSYSEMSPISTDSAFVTSFTISKAKSGRPDEVAVVPSSQNVLSKAKNLYSEADDKTAREFGDSSYFYNDFGSSKIILYTDEDAYENNIHGKAFQELSSDKTGMEFDISVKTGIYQIAAPANYADCTIWFRKKSYPTYLTKVVYSNTFEQATLTFGSSRSSLTSVIAENTRAIADLKSGKVNSASVSDRSIRSVKDGNGAVISDTYSTKNEMTSFMDTVNSNFDSVKAEIERINKKLNETTELPTKTQTKKALSFTPYFQLDMKTTWSTKVDVGDWQITEIHAYADKGGVRAGLVGYNLPHLYKNGETVTIEVQKNVISANISVTVYYIQLT